VGLIRSGGQVDYVVACVFRTGSFRFSAQQTGELQRIMAERPERASKTWTMAARCLVTQFLFDLAAP
jgi:hypothetical protein